MNCKPGDLAVVIKTKFDKHLLGKIVTCIRLDSDPGFEDCWIVEPTCFGVDGCVIAFTDDNLLPIRDNPGEDETLTWAPVPHKEIA